MPMDPQNLRQTLASYSDKNLALRKRWYSPAAEAYNQARPHYPQDLILQVAKTAQLSPASRILEIGCGPATATTAFAQLGYSILCLEPNPDFYKLAQENCRAYSNVEIRNLAFEEWEPEIGAFDAVLAASSFHWIPPDIAYSKSAQILRKEGHLILLWNKELQPLYEAHQRLSEVYQVHAPSLERFEDKETQAKILQGLGQMILESGLFKTVVANQIEAEKFYSADQYLALLNTYSSYLQLDEQSKAALFAGLKDKIENEFSGSLQLFHISASHVAQKL
ncbi:MAG: class I SAM-dependent methyltransferase [Cyanobacteria bacterium P01_F01_bin.86]